VSESKSSNADVVQRNDARRWVKKGRIFKEGKMREEKRNTSSLSPP
jgi:16S rRNA U516 pseudouridylate synthase RsuA-like enzyme